MPHEHSKQAGMGHLYAQVKKWVGRGVCSFDFLLFAEVRSARPVSLFLCVTRDLSISKCRAAQATRCARLLDKFLTAAADKQSGLCSHRLSCVQAAQLKQMWVVFKLSSPVFSPYILPLPLSANWNWLYPLLTWAGGW